MAYSGKPIPIQRPNFRPEDLDPANGLQYFNQFTDQLVNAANLAIGAVGPSVLPSGIDVKGGRVTGLAAPQHPSDAISSGHAQSQFSPETLGPKLDVGGSNAMPGLTVLAQTISRGVPGVVTIPLAKLTGGGSDGSITFTNGQFSGFVIPT